MYSSEQRDGSRTWTSSTIWYAPIKLDDRVGAYNFMVIIGICATKAILNGMFSSFQCISTGWLGWLSRLSNFSSGIDAFRARVERENLWQFSEWFTSWQRMVRCWYWTQILLLTYYTTMYQVSCKNKYISRLRFHQELRQRKLTIILRYVSCIPLFCAGTRCSSGRNFGCLKLQLISQKLETIPPENSYPRHKKKSADNTALASYMQYGLTLAVPPLLLDWFPWSLRKSPAVEYGKAMRKLIYRIRVSQFPYSK